MQFRVLWYMRLRKNQTLFRIKPGSQPVECDLQRILFDLGSIRVIGSQSMPVRQKERAVILLLHLHPVRQRADVVSQVQFPSRAHATDNALTNWVKMQE